MTTLREDLYEFIRNSMRVCPWQCRNRKVYEEDYCETCRRAAALLHRGNITLPKIKRWVKPQ